MDHLAHLRQDLQAAEQNRPHDDYPRQTTEYKRQLVINAAISAVNELLLEGSDGSVEETDYLYSSLALKLTEQVHHTLQSKLLRYDLIGKPESVPQ